MSVFINQYSFLIVTLGLILVAGLVLLTNRPRVREYISFSLITLAAVLTLIILHPRQTPLMEDAQMVQQYIGAGTPVLLEFQSPYCISCTQVQPIVDQLEVDVNNEISIGKRLFIIRLNIQDHAAQELAPIYHFEYTPTFIFFDGQGRELWRTVGEFDPQKVRDSLP